MKNNYFLLSLIAFAFFTQTAFTQNRDQNRTARTNESVSSLFFSAGGSRCIGDFRSTTQGTLFAEPFNFSLVRYELSLGYRHSFSNRLGYRVSLHHGLYESTDLNQNFPNTTSNITMFTFLGEFDIFQSSAAARPWRVYVYGGGGLAYASINIEGGLDAARNAAGERVTFRTSTFAPIIPAGLGFDMQISPNFNIGVEGGFKYAFSDYLNGVRIAGSQNDMLLNVSITLSYRLCGLFRRGRCGC